MVRDAAIPLLQRRGGCAIKKSCEATLDAQTGWSETSLTTPSAPIKGCLRRYFLEVASTPPLEEGNSSSFPDFVLWATRPKACDVLAVTGESFVSEIDAK